MFWNLILKATQLRKTDTSFLLKVKGEKLSSENWDLSYECPDLLYRDREVWSCQKAVHYTDPKSLTEASALCPAQLGPSSLCVLVVFWILAVCWAAFQMKSKSALRKEATARWVLTLPSMIRSSLCSFLKSIFLKTTFQGTLAKFLSWKSAPSVTGNQRWTLNWRVIRTAQTLPRDDFLYRLFQRVRQK